MPKIELSQGTIDYREEGSGPPVVLIHGLLVDGTVWDRLVPLLAPEARCIVPDLPLGSHRRAMRPAADVTPAGVAALVAELLERLDLSDVTLVGNDTGGAISQLVCADHPDRIGRLVLTNCDAFEHFPPPALKPLIAGARIPGSLAALSLLGRFRFARSKAMSLAPLTVDPVPDEMLVGWLEGLHDRGVRADLGRTMRGMRPEVTLAAAERLRAFDRPALIAWGMRDAFFPFADAERLAATLPNARLERIDDARTFVQLDAPDRLAELIAAFVAETTTGAAAARPCRSRSPPPGPPKTMTVIKNPGL